MDKLGEILKATGYRIAEDGCRGEPMVYRLAVAAQAVAPVAAATLGSDEEPENARCRAFAHVVRAVELLPTAEREALAEELGQATVPGQQDAGPAGDVEPAEDNGQNRDTEPADDPARPTAGRAKVGVRSGACGNPIPA